MTLIYKSNLRNGVEAIGFYNKATVKTLRTKGKPFVAAVPNKYHGIKISYHDTTESARRWIHEEGTG